MRFIALCLLASLSSCYAEWDIPKTQRFDRCTGKVESRYFYPDPKPECANMPIRDPKDDYVRSFYQ
jgi:hypothetical protein